MTTRLYLLDAYRRGFRDAQSWKHGYPVRCPWYFWPSRWLAYHAGFDRGLYHPPPLAVDPKD